MPDTFMDGFHAFQGILKDSPYCLACGQLHTVCDWGTTCQQSAIYNMTDEEQRDFRLHQLREEFEAARDKVLDSEFTILGIGGITQRLAFPQLTDLAVDVWAHGGLTWEDDNYVHTAARRYIVAREFNEFRDGKWQVLAKLRWGGAR